MSISREENLKQLRKIRKLSKGTDVGDKINKDLNKKFGSKNITFKNQLDSHIDTWEEHTKNQKSYLNKKTLKTFEGFNEELQIGIKIEKEHGDLYDFFKNFLSEKGIEMPLTEDEFAEKIAKAHLREMKDYYTKLVKMENESIFESLSLNKKDLEIEEEEFKIKCLNSFDRFKKGDILTINNYSYPLYKHLPLAYPYTSSNGDKSWINIEDIINYFILMHPPINSKS